MICAWKEFLSVLPPRLRRQVDELGRESLQELRLRLGGQPELVMGSGSRWLTGQAQQEDLDYVVNAASRYSPWACATMAQGYLTAPGGHRIGLCGEAVCRDGRLEGLRQVRSLCIRVARDFPGLSRRLEGIGGSLLILGAPGWGKTTLLRDLIRRRGEAEGVCVVDERRELFPQGLPQGRRVDVLSGCPKAQGIEILLRTMSPGCIALDEITAKEDCQALLRGANCGVAFLATAHASSLGDFQSREVYGPILRSGVFSTVVVLRKDKSFTVERMGQ